MERVDVMSAEQYFEMYGKNGIGKGGDKWMIKRQLVDAFHKEIFGLVAMRGKQTFGHVPGMAFEDEIRQANEFLDQVREMKFRKKMSEKSIAEHFGLVVSDFRRVMHESNDIAEQGRIVKNVIKDTTRKWVKLCGMFAQYVETKDLIKPEDLAMTEEDILKDQTIAYQGKEELETHINTALETIKSTVAPAEGPRDALDVMTIWEEKKDDEKQP